MSKQQNTSIMPDEVVMNKIYLIRGQKVMFDKDLGEIYDVKPIRLREQVKRNKERFPRNFMFQLSEKEVKTMVSQFAIPSKQQLGGSLPYVFTEHGVLMLANVLRSGRSLQMSIRIIEIFVKLREMVLTHKDLLVKLNELESKVTNHDKGLKQVFIYLKQFIKEQKEPTEPIGFKQQKK